MELVFLFWQVEYVEDGTSFEIWLQPDSENGTSLKVIDDFEGFLLLLGVFWGSWVYLMETCEMIVSCKGSVKEQVKVDRTCIYSIIVTSEGH